MAPNRSKNLKVQNNSYAFWEKLRINYLNKNFVWKLVFDAHFVIPTFVALLIFELLLNIIIIERVKYTEIDWVAYMQEVEGFLNGTLDYTKLRGDTGPLVYPAGFVYIYSVLYYITNQGKNIYLAQYVFMCIYLLQQILNYRILWFTAKIPPWALVIVTLTSYRIHSIYVLRLFNDPIAILLFYVSLNFFISNKWILGSLFYSLAVSVKMNILLYAPCLLITYLTNLTIVQMFTNLFVCAIVQIILGTPFLLNNYWGYIKGSFDLGRVFEHQWTVNYRFLTRDIFESRLFHGSLFLLHIMLLLLFLPTLKRYLSSYANLNALTNFVKDEIKKDRKKHKSEKLTLDKYEKLEDKMNKTAQLFILPFYITNFIGIACARSLHYQFYCWYFYSILYLVFCTPYKKPAMFLLLGVIEYCWNVYPSTILSSVLLHICHIFVIYGVYRYMKN